MFAIAFVLVRLESSWPDVAHVRRLRRQL